MGRVFSPITGEAEATDKAGNINTTDITYEVLAWTLNGFFRPVDMGLLNTVKGGATVPLKFEVFAGDLELTDTSYITNFSVKQLPSCDIPEVIGTDAIEGQFLTTGGTSLRYDETGGQFIQNWKTKADQKGNCFKVTLTTDDGSSTAAFFKLK